MKSYILGILKNLAHPGTIIGLLVSIAIPFLIYLGPNVGHKSTIRNLDLYLPLPLFIVQLIAGIVLFALMLEITVAVSFYFSAAADAMLMLPDSGDSLYRHHHDFCGHPDRGPSPCTKRRKRVHVGCPEHVLQP